MKKKFKGLLIFVFGFITAIILFLVCIFIFFGNEEEETKSVAEESYEGNGLWGIDQVQDGLREYYTNTSDAKNVTMMVYMIASDSEREFAAATYDLQEMMDSNNGSALNIVVQTGGTKKWNNERISADKRQRWLVQNNQLTLCEDLPQDSMCKPENLTDFITWSANKFPADRYILVLWDHGGGTMGGYGYDENFPEDTLTISQMSAAVEQSGVKLDIIGYDACLMGTLEVGYAFEPSADYLLASEEIEPGSGWYYTDALSALSKNPAMPTVELGARFIDSYADFYSKNYNKRNITLSLLDLREVPPIYEACASYFDHAEETLQSGQDGFMNLSIARSKARSYGEGTCEQIDLVDYVELSNVDGKEELIQAVQSAVKYRNDSSLTGSCGTAIYFPYTIPSSYSMVETELEKISYTEPETFYNKFLSVLTSATAGNGELNDITEVMNNDMDYSTEPWFDDSVSQNYNFQTIQNPDNLVANYSEKDDKYLLDLTPEEWDTITDIQFQVLLDDGEGYVELGSDQHYDWTEDGDLIFDFDNLWMSIDGHLASFYALPPVDDGDTTSFIGKTNAVLNGDKEIDIYISRKYENNSEDGYTVEVLGYLPVEEIGSTRSKGFFTLDSGDEIQLQCNYYTYDGQYDNKYNFGEPFIITDQDSMVIDWIDLETSNVKCWFQLTDLFRQRWYTQALDVAH